eukprot:1156295-Pelagomonas_calceolata.AAC.6
MQKRKRRSSLYGSTRRALVPFGHIPAIHRGEEQREEKRGARNRENCLSSGSIRRAFRPHPCNTQRGAMKG